MPIPLQPSASSVALLDPYLGTNAASVTPVGELCVSQPAVQLFNDTFDSGTLDTLVKWTTPTAGGTGIAATNVVGQTVLDGGTTANSFSKLTSQYTFVPTEPGYLFNVKRINIESPVVLTAHRFWGLGTSIASPTIANPITQGVGFEIGTNGKLFAVVYQTGTRIPIQDLSASGTNKQPTDSAAHKYYTYFRGDICYWAIDNQDNVVAQYLTGASGPDINGLPLLLQVVSNSGTHATIVLNGVTVSDTAHTTFAVADGLYGFRKASVNSKALNVAPAANYTVISTAGTTTVAQGGGVFFGLNVVSTGTSWTATPYDIVVAGTTTNQLTATGTAASVGGLDIPGVTGLGVRFLGTLALVTTGTPGQFNALWD